MKSQAEFPYLSVADVARAAGISRVAVYKHLELGHLPFIRHPGFKNYMITGVGLRDFLAARAKGEFVRPPKRVKA